VQRRPSPDLVHELKMLLRRAQKGEFVGMAYVALLAGATRGYVVGTAGALNANPTYARGMVRSLDDMLAKHVGARTSR
jgi:hypothetical protein